MANNINANQRIDAVSVSGKIHAIAPFHGTAAEWDSNSLYIPAQGEIVIYDIDDNNDKSKFKIGDGETTVTNLPFFTCDNGGDEKQMYGVDANKDGNVELIFGVKPLITFTITSYVSSLEGTFQAELGMTWRQWLESDYCTTDDICIIDGFVYLYDGGYGLYDGINYDSTVSASSQIIANHNYQVSY